MTDDLAQFVAPGRCLCCGSRKLTWSPAMIVEACNAWYETHRETPAASDWGRATPEHPSRTTVCYVFGSWNAMLRAAGLFGRGHGGHNWSRDDVANAMLDELVTTGRWPSYHGWRSSSDTGHPMTATVIKMFGSWNAAKRYAGWNGSDDTAPAIPEPDVCAGCGGGLDGYTIGCRTCAKRKDNRGRRARRARANKCVSGRSPATTARAAADGDSVAAPAGDVPFATASDREAEAPAVRRREAA